MIVFNAHYLGDACLPDFDEVPDVLHPAAGNLGNVYHALGAVLFKIRESRMGIYLAYLDNYKLAGLRKAASFYHNRRLVRERLKG